MSIIDDPDSKNEWDELSTAESDADNHMDPADEGMPGSRGVPPYHNMPITPPLRFEFGLSSTLAGQNAFPRRIQENLQAPLGSPFKLTANSGSYTERPPSPNPADCENEPDVGTVHYWATLVNCMRRGLNSFTRVSKALALSAAQRTIKHYFICFFMFLLSNFLLLGKLNSPICSYSILADMKMCLPSTGLVVANDFPALANVHSLTLSALYDGATGVWRLSDELGKRRSASALLSNYVLSSTLKNKYTLSDALHKLSKGTHVASRSLNKLGARVVGTVTRTSASFEDTRRTLADVKTTVEATRVVVDVRGVQKQLDIVFHRALGELSEDLQELQSAARFTLGDLDILEERLNAVHTIARRQDKTISGERDGVLASPWTMFGVNDKELRDINDNLDILKEIDKYCVEAREVVLVSLNAVEMMDSEMEYLRSLPSSARLGVAIDEQMGLMTYRAEEISRTLGAFDEKRALERAKRYGETDQAETSDTA
ncbi:hypothetical protein M0805_008798 [Coniferiporia weirii]|nr:hypothetical protein M0805_008798 [Coniferiporia weirii]